MSKRSPIDELFSYRQRHAYLLRHVEKLTDKAAAAVMGFRGKRPAAKYNALVRRAEARYEQIRQMVQRVSGDCSLLDEFISSAAAAGAARRSNRQSTEKD